jgi:hypothetical protein
MTVRMEPDAEHQLNDILNLLESKAKAQGEGTINLLALDGRRYYQGRPGAEWYAELQFIIRFPGEFVDPRDRSAQERLAAELRELGRSRNENWVVDIRPYTGQFIDVLAGNYEPVGPGQIAPPRDRD